MNRWSTVLTAWLGMIGQTAGDSRAYIVSPETFSPFAV
jgi:hypothetical protein